MEDYRVNLNPFTANGVVSRLQYLGTRAAMMVVFGIPLNLIMEEIQKDPGQDGPFRVLLIILPLVFWTYFNLIIKRVRDIKGDEFSVTDGFLWCIGAFIPLVNLVTGIRLFFQRGEITSQNK